MTEDELNEAVEAQVRWLQSQDLTIEDSILVCAKTICLAILKITKANQGDANKGARAIAATIVDTIKGAEDGYRRPRGPRRRPF